MTLSPVTPKPKECAPLVLPWPSRDLHPNARVHWSRKAKAAKQARESAAWATKGEWQGVRVSGGATLAMAFYPPDKRRRDLDGCLSAMKSALDGIADALVIDDSRFHLTLRMCAPVKGGKVEVRLVV